MQKIFNLFTVFIILYLISNKVFKTENMSNTDIKKIIEEQYKIDIDAIRNLSKLANDLTINNKLIVPGGLEIEGDLTVKKNINAKQDIKADGNGYFGPAYIGKYGKTNSDYAHFSHKNMTSNKQYALLQKNDGHTYLNTASKEIYFRSDNSNKMTLKSNGNFSVKQDIEVDGNGYFGPAYIGKYAKTRSDWAQFCHVKMTGGNQYAIAHHQGGTTNINAASGTSLSFNIKDKRKMHIQSNGDIRMNGVLACDNHAHFNNGAHFYGWSGWATKDAQRPYSGYSSSNVYIKGINENGHLYIGTKYGNTISSKKAT